MRRIAPVILACALMLHGAPQKKNAQPLPQDLGAIRSDPQPERRYWNALEFASGRIDSARRNYHEGKLEGFHQDIHSIGEAVQLCDETLRATGKNPSKNPKHFKRAELKEREISRRLRTLEDEVGVDDRGELTKVRTRVSELHDELLFDIMGRRK